MERKSEIRKIAFIGDYLPRKCGIATFTHDLCSTVAAQFPSADCFVVPVNDIPEGYDYPPEVRFEIEEKDLDSYLRAADFLNFSNTDIVCLQHEYGIFGGPAGSHILSLLRDLRAPLVTTFHTVLGEPGVDQRRVLKQIAEMSAQVIVMTEKARRLLQEVFAVPEGRITLIPHGIPDMPFVDPNFFKDQFGVEGKFVVLTFGLLSPNKGIEHMLHALPTVLREYPNLVYLVLGATHPNLLREQGENYRISLKRLTRRLGISRQVIFYNRFVDLNELKEFIGSADIYVTPYLNPAQITSGTLAYSFGCGKAVVSTPYWHAEELLAEGRGVLVPFANPEALAQEIVGLLRDEPRRHAMRKKAYLMGREMVWSQVAHLYVEAFRRARRARADTPGPSLAMRTLEEQQAELPDWRFDHLEQLTDATGIFQHACFAIPNFVEGYCTDDNARALLLTVYLDELGEIAPWLQRMASSYAAFINAAFDPGRRRFRNFLSFDRSWLEQVGSDDCYGRALWALGACIERSKRRDIQFWAVQTFERALPGITETASPRGWAFSLLGINEYLHRLSGDRHVSMIRDTLLGRLVELYEKKASDDWPWFEDMLSYDNAQLPHALIASGLEARNLKAQDIGLKALGWLTEVQKAPHGHFRPIGSNGFYVKGQDRAQFDQQPIEAHATVCACLAAYRATGQTTWLREAHTAFEWFLGRNDLGLEIYDATTGGCRDGLQEDRVNQNQGAESTLAFLLSLAEIHLMATKLTVLAHPTDGTGEHGPHPESDLKVPTHGR
jgi:glycosyltransferase involved in cell wall biosynthesis